MPAILTPPSGVRPSYASGYAPRNGPPAYPGLWQGLDGLWVPSLGATGGTLFDIAGRNHGRLDAVTPPVWVISEKGLALDFDGLTRNMSVAIPSRTYAYTDNWSLSYWAEGSRLSGNEGGILGKAFEQNSFIWHRVANYWQIRTTDAVTHNWTSVTDFAGWHLYTLTAEASGNFELFVDGESHGVVARSNSDFTFDTINKVWNSAALIYDGQVGSIATFGRALAPSEIQTLFTNPDAHITPQSQVPVIGTAAPPTGVGLSKIIGGGILSC